MNHHRLVDGADDVVKYISVHILFQILLRFPVRLLLRFRCVCKEWCELIDSRVFKDAYLALRRAMPVDDQLLVLHTPDRLRSFPVSVKCWYGDYQSLALYASTAAVSCGNDFVISDDYTLMINIIDHVDGLVCFIDEGDTWLSKWDKNLRGSDWLDLTLVNPALREIRKLLLPEFDDVLGEIHKRQVQGVGFGYDESSNEYKVVAIVTVYEDETCQYTTPCQHIVIVYHLSTNCWTVLGDMSEFVSRHPFLYLPYRRAVFSHGSLHWCTLYGDPHVEVDGDNTKYHILAFDLTSGSFRQILFPHDYREVGPFDHRTTAPQLFVVDKSTVALVATQYPHYFAEPVVEVWVMKEYGEADSWTKRCSITDFVGVVKPICFWKEDKIILDSQVTEGLICYDLSQPPVEEEPVAADEGGLPPCMSSGIPRRGLCLVPGHESFVSVKQP